VPVPGHYAVRLHFAETCQCATEPGQRIFDIELEGSVVKTLDIVEAAGWRRPHTVASTVSVVDGALTLEMLGIVRNPVLSGIEVSGPVAHAQQTHDTAASRSPGQTDGGAHFWSAEPPDDASVTADGEEFELAHVSTGTLHRLDFRFSVAYDSNSTVRLFRVDVARADVDLAAFELQCMGTCAADSSCAGVFVRTLQTTYYCNGLAKLGHPVGTRSTSRSWRRANVEAVSHAQESMPWWVNRLDAGTGWDKDNKSATRAFQGQTAANAKGPWLTFSTTFARHLFVFSEDLSPVQCIERCQSFASCLGVVIWVPPDDVEVLSCIGLQHLGTKAGIETELNCISLRVVRGHGVFLRFARWHSLPTQPLT